MTLEEQIGDRVRKLNPYYSGPYTNASEKDIDKLIIDAAWQIQHPPKPPRAGRHKKTVE